MIDKTDLRLISELEKNGRASYSQLAKSLELNIFTVTKRVQALLKDKAIAIKAVPNPYKMGYTSQAFIGMNVSLKSVNDICAKLSRNFNISLLLTSFGRFNLLATVQFSTWDMLVNFVSTELPAMGSIYEIETFFIKDVKKRYYGIFGKQASGQPPVKIDDINQRLIEELSNNGRYSGTYLATKLGIDLSTVSRRLSYLLKERIIRILAISDPTKAGYQANALVLIRANFKKIDDICAQLYPYSEVITIMTLANGYDIVISIVAKDTETLYELNKNKLVNIPGIVSMETLVRGHVLKRYYGSFSFDEARQEAEARQKQTLGQGKHRGS